MRVMPAPGLQVRDPATLQLVPAEGIEIDPTDLVWARILADGDVVEVPAQPAPPPASRQPQKGA